MPTTFTVSLTGPHGLRHRVTLRAASREEAFRAAQNDACMETGITAEAWRLAEVAPAARAAA